MAKTTTKNVGLCLCVHVCAGYQGDSCQVDTDECEHRPCENGGTCFQRSDIPNYGSLPEFSNANFSYEEAAGFICRCLPGFTGKTVPNMNSSWLSDKEIWIPWMHSVGRRQLLSRCGRVWACSMSQWRNLSGSGELLSVCVSRRLHG